MAVLGLVQDQLLYGLRVGATSLFTLFIGLLIGKITGRAVYVLFIRTGLDAIAKSLPVKFSATQFLSQLITYFIDVVALILALHVLNIAFVTGFFILAALVFFLVLGMLLLLYDFFRNILVRMLLMLRGIPVKLGTSFQFMHLSGTVTAVHLTFFNLRMHQETYEVPYVTLLNSREF